MVLPKDPAPGARRLVFEPLYRNQPAHRFPAGMGLGLSIANDLIVAHGGRLEIESVLGQGSQFTLWLPNAR